MAFGIKKKKKNKYKIIINQKKLQNKEEKNIGTQDIHTKQ